MKTPVILTALIMWVCLPISAQPAWEAVNFSSGEQFVNVFFINDQNGWIISSEGTVFRTSNGGETWESHAYPEYNLKSIYFADENTGYITGWHVNPPDSSLILKTMDGGLNWSELEHPDVIRLNDVFAYGDSEIWAVGTYGDLNLNCCLYSGDGGDNWTQQMQVLVSGAELLSVHFRDNLIGSACGADGAFVHTNSGGVSGWSFNISMPLENLNALWNMGTLLGCAVGDNGTAIYTINDWYQHIDQNTGTTEHLYGVHAEPLTNKVWAVGANGTIIYCPNYLLGWASQESGTTEHLYGIHMISDMEGWAVGANGTVLKYSIGTSVPSLNNGPEFTVSPSPGDGCIRITFKKPLEIERLEVIDMLGQVDRTYVLDTFEKQTELDLRDLQNGIYFLAAYSSRGTGIQKLVIR